MSSGGDSFSVALYPRVDTSPTPVFHCVFYVLGRHLAAPAAVCES